MLINDEMIKPSLPPKIIVLKHASENELSGTIFYLRNKYMYHFSDIHRSINQGYRNFEIQIGLLDR